MPFTGVLGILYGISELALAIFKRAAKSSASADRGSLWLLWVVIVASINVAILCTYRLPQLHFGSLQICQPVGSAIFAAGIALRWYAIVYLGRFFTVNVAIATDHRLIDSGPYRYIRHPSYSGALLAFLGLGIGFCNFASLAVMVVPTLLVFLRRMQVEEAALSAALGSQYLDYMRKTRRLIPALY